MIERCEPGAVPLAFDALRESEARLRSAIDASGMGTFIWRVDDNCVEPDARMRTLFGLPLQRSFTLDEIIDAVEPVDRARCKAAFARAVTPPGIVSLREESRVRDYGRSIRWLEIRATTVFTDSPAFESRDASEGRRAARVAGVASDITDRKHRDATLS